LGLRPAGIIPEQWQPEIRLDEAVIAGQNLRRRTGVDEQLTPRGKLGPDPVRRKVFQIINIIGEFHKLACVEIIKRTLRLSVHRQRQRQRQHTDGR